MFRGLEALNCAAITCANDYIPAIVDAGVLRGRHPAIFGHGRGEYLPGPPPSSARDPSASSSSRRELPLMMMAGSSRRP